MQKTLLSLIQEAKPRRALFTTYTFSVFWFEAFVLPTLRNCGCEQIDLLIDAREAQRSTEEATSLHAGAAYRVIPVEMKDGSVFHPKLVYMQGDSYDNLVVSSGNLTLSGYGKNLEVLDAVSSHTDPGVFHEFADFLSALQAKHEFSHENGKVIEGYRLRALARRDLGGMVDASARDTWLVHTLETPAADQFAVLADRVQHPEALTVLSPYHSPSGRPVQRLAAALNALQVRIGVHAKTRIVPFAEDKLVFSDALKYVSVRTNDPYRFPHAKCFELEGANGVLVMTGSVNATAQSLETTRNVEVSLVRFLKKSPFEWNEVEPAAFKPCEFEHVGRLGQSLSLQATWTASQYIVGVLKPARGAMNVELSIWEGPRCLELMRDIALSEDGAFRVRMKDYFETERALRLVLRGEGMGASTWLNLEFALTADESERKLLRAGNRMRSGDYHLDDIETIFKWLQGLQAKMQPSALNKDALRPATQRDKGELGAREKISYEEWRNSVEQYGGLARSTHVARVSLEAAFRWLNRDIEGLVDGDSKDESKGQLGRSKAKSADLSAGRRMRLLTTDDAEYEDNAPNEDEQRSDIEEESNRLFQHLIESLPLALTRDSQSPIVPMMVELAGCATLKRAFVYRTAGTGVLPPVEPLALDAWLQQYAAFDYSPENRIRLLPFFCAMACCAAHYHYNSAWSALKESMERLAGRVLAAGEMEMFARLALGSPRFLRVPTEDHEAIATSASAIHDCATLTEQLMSLIIRIFRDEQPAPHVEAPYVDVFNSLRAQKRKNKPFLFGIIRGKGNHCFCGFTLHQDDARRLRHERVWVCKGMSCGRPLFYELDAAYLEQKGLAGRFKEPRNA